VNSFHHQGVASVGALVATGWAPDDEVDGVELVEVVEDPAKQFAIGVQWHPEQTSDWRLFAALVEAARSRRTNSLSMAE
jgi:putative glutamine amidotransferase